VTPEHAAADAPKRQRLDERVVADGLAETRTRAQALIRTGRVLVDETPVEKPGTAVRREAAVRVRGSETRFVSRGGEKLAGALTDFGLDPTGCRCLDVGASTGGFSDCLLQAGARQVVAVDVGYGQLAARLRADPRVFVLERTNARELASEALPGPIDLVVADVSFISLRLLLPRLLAVAPAAELLLLVKPQFEVGRGQVGKGGVVRDDGLRAAAVASVRSAAEALGYRFLGQAESCLAGPKGNREIFLRLGRPPADPGLGSEPR
jgi:23S rRNA (cytidine1920-2'-O)/16S rRNA (cytidine1409-2'-O)-methyltransferase